MTAEARPEFVSRTCPFCGSKFDCSPNTPEGTPCSKKRCPGLSHSTFHVPPGKRSTTSISNVMRRTMLHLSRLETEHLGPENKSTRVTEILTNWLPKMLALCGETGETSPLLLDLGDHAMSLLDKVHEKMGVARGDIIRVTVLLDLLCNSDGISPSRPLADPAQTYMNIISKRRKGGEMYE